MRLRLAQVGLALVLAAGMAGTQQTVFGWAPVGSGPEAPAVVTFTGSRLFTITMPAGGLNPATRAQVIAARLEALRQAGTLTPGSIGTVQLSGLPDHAVITCTTTAGCASILTVDPALAKDVAPQQANVAYVAAWWASLLADHLLAAAGQPPQYTVGTPVGDLLTGIASRIARDPRLTFSDALATLSRTQTDTLNEASQALPPGWQPHPLGQAVTPAPAPAVAEPAPGPAVAVPAPQPGVPAPAWKVVRQANDVVITWEGDPAALQSVQFVLVDKNFDPLQVIEVNQPPFTARFSSPPTSAVIRIWATDASGNETLTLLPVTTLPPVRIPGQDQVLPQPGPVPGQLQNPNF